MFKPEFSRKKNSDLSVVLSCQWDLLPNKTKNIKCRGRKRWKERKCPWLFLHLLYYFSWLSERHEDWNLRQKYKWCVEIFVQTIRDIICLQKSSWTFISKPLPSGIILHIISYDDEFFFPFLFLESIWRSKINDNWSFSIVVVRWKKNIKLSFIAIFSCIPWIICLDFGAPVMACDALHGTYKQSLLLVQTHIIRNHFPQGDFDIIGGTSALTEAEVIKVLVSTLYFYTF